MRSSVPAPRNVTLSPTRTLTSTMWPILHDIAGRTKVVYWQYMSIMLNHTIVAAKDRKESADFLTELFGLPDAQEFGHFLAVNVANDVSLDYAEVPDGEEIRPQHYAFLVSEDEFDSIYGKIRNRGIQHWADPRGKQAERDQPQRRRPRRLLPGSGRATTSRSSPGRTAPAAEPRASSTATPSPRRRDSAFGRSPRTDTRSAALPSTTGPRRRGPVRRRWR